MQVNQNQFLSIEQLQDQLRTQKQTIVKGQNTSEISFQEILAQQATQTDTSGEEVKFSKHAANRLAERSIELTEDQLERLNQGSQKAGSKGINESLVIVDQLAFIVNTKKNTVITAMDQSQADDNVFTNIDGAVIV